MDKETIIQYFEDFLNENGLWYSFSDWLEERAKTPTDLGFKED